MQHDPLIALCQQIADLHRAECAADDRGDTDAMWRCVESARPLIARERDLAPQSDAGAVLKVRMVVDVASSDEDPASSDIAKSAAATIRAVERAAKGPQVVVSRADPALVQRLFEMEVPEIYDATVQIRAVAREAGERTKIAVESRDKDVDPVGACVGMKGMRVQSIIRELRGEKIDIIPYNEDTVTFAQKALSPAKVTRVQIVDPETRSLEVIVEDTQLSLAIGKKGQNVRLASKLIGWNIDIKSEEEKRREIEAQMAALTAPGTALSVLQGVGPKTIEKLEAAGVTSVEKLADMTPEQLIEIPGIGEKMVEKIHQAVAAYFEALETLATAAPAESEHALEAPVEGEPAVEAPAEGAPEALAVAESGETSEAEQTPETPETAETPQSGEAEDSAEKAGQ